MIQRVDGAAAPSVPPRPAAPAHGGAAQTAAGTPAQAPDRITTSTSSTPHADLVHASDAAAAHGHVIVDRTGALESTPNGHLPANATIEERGYRFTTDERGRVSSASGHLQISPTAGAPRSSAAKQAQREVGWQDRLPDDQGGHLIGDRFNGPSELHNLFAQNGNFNMGEYKKLENSWASELKNGNSVNVDVQLHYDTSGNRPERVSVTHQINDEIPIQNTFENRYKGGREPAPAASAANDAREFAPQTRDLSEIAAGARDASVLERGAKVLGRVGGPVALAADGIALYGAYKQDGGRVGMHTAEAAGSAAGGWAGAAVGAETGAEAGAAVGAFFGGVGAVPGALIGGAVGGIAGGVAGSAIGQGAVHLGADAIDVAKKGLHGIENFLGL